MISEGQLDFDAVFSPDSWYTDEDIYLAQEIYNLKRFKEILSLPESK